MAAWTVAVVVALWLSAPLPSLLHGGIGTVPGSSSERVEQVLSRDFDLPFAQFLIAVVEPNGPNRPPAPVARLLAERFADHPAVARTMIWPTAPHRPAVVVLGLKATSLDAAERLVMPIRQAAQAVIRTAPGFHVLVSGQAALNVDMAEYASQESSASERRVLPFTLIALLLAFGALGAATSPLVAGTAAVLVAVGLISLVARGMLLSVFAANVASMLGLGLGIDYALFVVTRIREERRQGADPMEAVRRAARHAAPVIAVSAATVMIGLAVLVTVPVQDLIGIGIGGCLVALTSAAAGITLLPALAAGLGDWLDVPRRLSARFTGEARALAWERRGQWVVDHPIVMGVTALVILTAMSLPVSRLHFGYPEIRMLPQGIETIQAMRSLAPYGGGGALMPIRLLFSAPEGQSMLTPERLAGTAAVIGQFRRDRRVQSVTGLPDPDRGLPMLLAGAQAFGPEGLRQQLPEQARWLVSRDGHSLVIQVVLQNRVSIAETKALDREWRERDWAGLPGLTGVRVDLGGAAALEHDVEGAALGAMPRIAVVVVLATLLMLFGMTRSWLIPLKAVVANAFTVMAALGGTVWLFQHPWACRWLGLAEPLASVPPGIPILAFCVLFGLSMDYEVFLISRIQEAHAAGADDRQAVVAGLRSSGAVITSAAAIMTVVFVGFAMTDLMMVKMLGVVLTLGIALDATVVRLGLVPSLLVLMGRYNWSPGDRWREPADAVPAAGNASRDASAPTTDPRGEGGDR
jgi:RND superfamily putative drug exporter